MALLAESKKLRQVCSNSKPILSKNCQPALEKKSRNTVGTANHTTAGHAAANSNSRKTCCDIRPLASSGKKVGPSTNAAGGPGTVARMKQSVVEIGGAKNRSRQNDSISKKLHVVSLIQRYDTTGY